MKKLLYLLIILQTSLFAQYTNTVYVDPSNGGDPNEDGSIDHPYDSWEDFSTESRTAYLQKRGTTYDAGSETLTIKNDSLVKIGAYGTGSLPIFRSSSRLFQIETNTWRIHIDSIDFYGSDPTYSSCNIQGSYSSVKHIYNISITNCIFRNMYDGIDMIETTYSDIDTVLIKNCTIHDVRSDGIFGNAKRLTIEGCHIYNVNMNWHYVGHSQTVAGGDAIQIGDECLDFVIRNNVIDRRETGK